MPYAHLGAVDAWASASNMSLTSAWQNSFLAFTNDYDRACGPAESASVLRAMIKSKLLNFTDMRDSPERFFAAHRLLATKILGGFGIRFTVQFNLFAGSILGLGGERQVAMLSGFQERGELGCFALTEVGAGVLSGFIVKTTATYDAERAGMPVRPYIFSLSSLSL